MSSASASPSFEPRACSGGRALRLLAAGPLAVALAAQGMALVLGQERPPWRGIAAALAVLIALLLWRTASRPARGAALCAWAPALLLLALFVHLSVLEAWLLWQPILATGVLGLATAVLLHFLLLLLARQPVPVRSPPGRLLGRAALFATAVAASLFLAEATYSHFVPASVYEVVADDPRQGRWLIRHPTALWCLRPGFRGRCLHPEFPDMRVEINDYGMRDSPEEAQPPRPEEASVLVLGDSFAFGTGVQLEETFHELLEQQAATLCGRPLRVFGAGVPGFGQADALALLDSLDDLTRPHVVIVALYEGNDFADNLRATGGLEEPSRSTQAVPDPLATREFVDWEPEESSRDPGTTQLRDLLQQLRGWGFWLGSSAILQHARPALEEPMVRWGLWPQHVATNRFLTHALRREPSMAVMRSYVSTLALVEALQEACRERGAELILLVIPAAVQAEPERFEVLRRQTGGAHRDQLDRTLLHQSLVQALEQRGILVVDSLPVLEQSARDGRSAYHREGHWNALGHSLAARILHEPLRQALVRTAR